MLILEGTFNVWLECNNGNFEAKVQIVTKINELRRGRNFYSLAEYVF